MSKVFKTFGVVVSLVIMGGLIYQLRFVQ